MAAPLTRIRQLTHFMNDTVDVMREEIQMLGWRKFRCCIYIYICKRFFFNRFTEFSKFQISWLQNFRLRWPSVKLFSILNQKISQLFTHNFFFVYLTAIVSKNHFSRKKFRKTLYMILLCDNLELCFFWII